MEKQIPVRNQPQQPPPPPQETLKCPRCESSNTKFCYYNNYSLSQPRHFCKACKRYWTRGGTLRNVPVGGGCRKNKRVKRPITSHVPAAATSAPANPHHSTNPSSNPNLDHNPSTTSGNGGSNHHLNPLFYGLLPQNPNYPRFDTRVSGYDHLVPSNMHDLGLEFSSPLAHNSTSSYPSSMFGGGSASNTATMAALLASSRQQLPKFMGFTPYDVACGSSTEGAQNRMDWSSNFHGQNQNDQMEADPNSSLWNTVAGGGGGWLDPTNTLGSSVPSLI